MLVAGWQKLTLVDYPGKLATAVFLSGCNFRCPFCHNPQLVTGSVGGEITWEEVMEFLKRRCKYLDGVVLTGGEPLLNPEIGDWAREIKELGLAVKVDTNGSRPEVLKTLVKGEVVDYVAMDVKTALVKERYAMATGTDGMLVEKVLESADYFLKRPEDAGWDYEFRTTMVPGLVTADDLDEIGRRLRGGRRYFLQQFDNSHPMLDVAMADVRPYGAEDLKALAETMRDYFEICQVRNI